MLGLLNNSNVKDDIDPIVVANAYKYIDNYWPTLTRIHTQTTDTLFGLPKPYIVPADQYGNFRFNEQYYWDSYFIALGLVVTGKNQIAEDMLDNLFYMFEHFKMIPNASRLYMTSRSQPPILTSYILLIYHSNNKSRKWLQKAFEIAEDEYLNVWMGEVQPHWRQVYKGLSRYYDINVLHDLAESESGWDMTTRFDRKALDFLPIDLNCLLYKYEKDFQEISKILNDNVSVQMWKQRAKERKNTINELMWSNSRKFFFDFNYQKESRAGVWSLAGFYAMWSGLATNDQAEAMVKNLDKFICKGGLSATNKTLIDLNIFGSLKTQWVFPNGWAPLHFIVSEGLRRYGYKEEAEKITKKWLKTNLDWFNKKGEFIEKYNVNEPSKPPIDGVYPTPSGFAWTNAIFVYFAKQLGMV